MISNPLSINERTSFFNRYIRSIVNITWRIHSNTNQDKIYLISSILLVKKSLRPCYCSFFSVWQCHETIDLYWKNWYLVDWRISVRFQSFNSNSHPSNHLFLLLWFSFQRWNNIKPIHWYNDGICYWPKAFTNELIITNGNAPSSTILQIRWRE
jgi:hypothetical protein